HPRCYRDWSSDVCSSDLMRRALPEIRRICARQLLVLDPNPTIVIPAGRRLIRHQDEELPCVDALGLLEEHGWRVRRLVFRDVVEIGRASCRAGGWCKAGE